VLWLGMFGELGTCQEDGEARKDVPREDEEGPSCGSRLLREQLRWDAKGQLGEQWEYTGLM
jgi:hypothetical protein